MNPQHRHQRIGWTAAFALWVMRFNQSNQTLSGYDPTHFDQEQLLADLLALTGVLGIGEGHLLHHRKTRRLVSGDFVKSGSLFQNSPNTQVGVVDSMQTSLSIINGMKCWYASMHRSPSHEHA